MKPKYNTWIRFKRMLIFLLIFFFCITFSFFTGNILLKLFILFISVPFGYISIILLISYYYFSESGGNYQNTIHDKIVSKIELENTASILDIGAGSGSLSIKTAKKNSSFQVKAIDYWGKEWEYSKSQCINNAQIEHIGQQINFIKASASELPFENETFDVVISCLTFHEVQDTKDKNIVVSEAFRVLKSGGQFVFFDLFNDKKIFGSFENFVDKLRANGVTISEVTNIEDILENCPKILLNKKVLGNGVLISGKKL